MMRALWMIGWLVLAVFAPAQTPVKPAAPPKTEAGSEAQESPEAKKLGSLKLLVESLSGALAEVDKLRAELKQTTSEERKTEINTRIETERARIRDLRGNFQEVVGGAEAAQYDEVTELGKDSTVQQEIQELVRPVLGELRNVTSRPREMEGLRRSLDSWRVRLEKAEVVSGRIDGWLKKAEDPKVKEELKAAKRTWDGRRADAKGQVEALTVRIAEQERLTPSLWETVSRMFIGFWRSRGLNLLIAMVVALAGFVLVRKSYQWLWRVGPLKRRSRATLMGRLADVTAVAAAFLVAICGVLLVFYVRGDWLLLTVAAILLLGAAWGGKSALPPYFNQIRLILNLGAVREGERVVYQGVPWKVKSLGVFSTLSNPALAGGELRLPLREVLPMISREAVPKEPWFPTDENDWVVMDDGTYGKVINQTPERVVVLKLGGSLKTYPTVDFLGKHPENLSNGFRVSSVFGIDYAHLPEATGEVLEIFGKALTAGLTGEFGRDMVRSVQIEFAKAGASSLDYLVQADCAGGLASRLRQIERLIQRICTDVCVEQGWTIPFTQITVHEVGAENADP